MVSPAGERLSQPNLFHQISFVTWSHTVGRQHSYDSYSCKGLGLKVLGDGIRGPIIMAHSDYELATGAACVC